MLDYRLYFMSNKTGHIQRFEEFEAEDHEAAKQIAAAKLDSQPLELWHRHLKVQRFEPANPKAPQT
jgi:hypothetical protein